MPGVSCLADTTVLIDLMNGDHDAMTFCNTILKDSGVIYISTITTMEVLVGARNKKELAYLSEFLTIFTPLQLTEDIGELALVIIQRYRLAHGLSIPDALIAATALVRDLVLCTDNTKHFKYIQDLMVQKPY